MLASEYVNLFDDHNSILATQAHQYQDLFNMHGSSVVAESCGWLLSVLKKSTAAPLMQQINQTYNNLPLVLHVGLSLFKLIMDQNDQRSFKLVQGLVIFLSTFNRWSFDGENLTVATSCLSCDAGPPSICCFCKSSSILSPGYVKGLERDIQDMCSSLWGSVNNSMYVEWAHHVPIALYLESFAGTLSAKYKSLCTPYK